MATILKESQILKQLASDPTKAKLEALLRELHRRIQHEARKQRTGCG